MIGIKVQNLIWEKALLNLLGNNAEKYQENHTYHIVLSETKDSNIPTLILGKDITLPFTAKMLKDKIAQIQGPEFENGCFKWLSQTRQLIHKKSQKIIQLTEKESDIIGFLAQCPQRKATKEEILQAVWHYQNDIHTHTVESHIYAINQKTTSCGDELLSSKNGVYTLINESAQ